MHYYFLTSNLKFYRPKGLYYCDLKKLIEEKKICIIYTYKKRELRQSSDERAQLLCVQMRMCVHVRFSKKRASNR